MLAIEAILKADTMWGEGRRGAGREKKKRKKTLAPAHRNQAVFCDTQKKEGGLLPTSSHATEQIPSAGCCLCSSVSLP